MKTFHENEEEDGGGEADSNNIDESDDDDDKTTNDNDHDHDHYNDDDELPCVPMYFGCFHFISFRFFFLLVLWFLFGIRLDSFPR